MGPVVAVEVECSLLSVEPELLEVIKACEELDIAVVGYCASISSGAAVSSTSVLTDPSPNDGWRSSPRLRRPGCRLEVTRRYPGGCERLLPNRHAPA